MEAGDRFVRGALTNQNLEACSLHIEVTRTINSFGMRSTKPNGLQCRYATSSSRNMDHHL